MTTASIPPRCAARVLLLDPKDRVLLIRFEIMRQGEAFVFWATPGGGLEPGEDVEAAARRELAEELGLRLALTGPVHESSARFEHEGTLIENRDTFFHARWDEPDPQLIGVTDEERQAMRGARWWTADEITCSPDPIFPPDLADLVRRVASL